MSSFFSSSMWVFPLVGTKAYHPLDSCILLWNTMHLPILPLHRKQWMKKSPSRVQTSPRTTPTRPASDGSWKAQTRMAHFRWTVTPLWWRRARSAAGTGWPCRRKAVASPPSAARRNLHSRQSPTSSWRSSTVTARKGPRGSSVPYAASVPKLLGAGALVGPPNHLQLPPSLLQLPPSLLQLPPSLLQVRIELDNTFPLFPYFWGTNPSTLDVHAHTLVHTHTSLTVL